MDRPEVFEDVEELIIQENTVEIFIPSELPTTCSR